MQDNAAELDTQVAIADGLFFCDIFWMTSASLAAIIWKGRIISSHNNEKFRVLNMNLRGQLGGAPNVESVEQMKRELRNL